MVIFLSLIMINSSVVFDDESLSDEESGETIKLQLYSDWKKNSCEFNYCDQTKEFPRVNSQVPLSPKDIDEDGTSEVEPERGNWTGRFDFILSLLGYSVGLGNVWRFPYLCYKNGGGAFLIPFIAMMLLAGLPLMFMELAFGQFASLGPVVIFDKFCPLFKGLGYGMVMVSGIVMLYYNMIIAWTLFYMFSSISSKLPWESCDPKWSTPMCYSFIEADECSNVNGTYINQICYNSTIAHSLNLTQIAHHMTKKTPSDEYFNHHVLNISEGIDETGGIHWPLAISLFVAWLIVFLCLSRGVKSSGKVVYFTALFPYVVLIILFIRGVTLPGAINGILFYITPDWRHLNKAQVWGDAAVQIFFALSPAWGGLITLASYNKFNNNCFKDSLIVSISNVLTSIFAGFVIFSVLGYLAHEMDTKVDEVVNKDSGLAFMVYPEVVARLPIASLWSFLFFFMLLTLGLDSQFALLETVQTAILDRFPHLRGRKVIILCILSILGYLGGLIFTTRGGYYWLNLFNDYAANFSVLLMAIFECIIIAWYYGAERFLRDIEKMIGSKSYYWTLFWSLMWKYLTPFTLVFILTFSWIKYDNSAYPHWANIIGWIITLLPVIVVILMAIYQYIVSDIKGSCWHKLSRLMQNTDGWGPAYKNITNGMKTIPEDNGDMETLNQDNSFDNPSFNVTYTFETSI